MKDQLLDHYVVKNAEEQEIERMIAQLPPIKPAMKLKNQLRFQLWILPWYTFVLFFVLTLWAIMQCGSYVREPQTELSNVYHVLSIYILCICGLSLPQMLRSRQYGMEEMEMSCRMTFAHMVLGRLFLIYGGMFVCSLLMSAWISVMMDVFVLQVLFLISVSMMGALSITLWIAKRLHIFQGSNLLILFMVISVCMEPLCIPLCMETSFILLAMVWCAIGLVMIVAGKTYWKELIQDEAYTASSNEALW